MSVFGIQRPEMQDKKRHNESEKERESVLSDQLLL